MNAAPRGPAAVEPFVRRGGGVEVVDDDDGVVERGQHRQCQASTPLRSIESWSCDTIGVVPGLVFDLLEEAAQLLLARFRFGHDERAVHPRLGNVVLDAVAVVHDVADEGVAVHDVAATHLRQHDLAPRRVAAGVDHEHAGEARHRHERPAVEPHRARAPGIADLRQARPGGVVGALGLRGGHEHRDVVAGARADRGDAAGVVGMRMGEDDAAHARGIDAERVGGRLVRLDRLGVADHLDRLAERGRLLRGHAGVDEQDAPVRPFEHERRMAHDVGLGAVRIALGIEHARPRHRLARGVDDGDPQRLVVDDAAAGDVLHRRQRRALGIDRPVRPPQAARRDEQQTDHRSQQPPQDASHAPPLSGGLFGTSRARPSKRSARSWETAGGIDLSRPAGWSTSPMRMEQPGSLTYNAGGASFLRGWPLTLSATIATATACSFAYTLVGGGLEGWHSVVRTSAKTSLAFFLAAFVASSVRALWRTPATAWLLANRRYVGVSFAASHAIHLVAILAVVALSPDFQGSTTTVIFGGFGYVLSVRDGGDVVRRRGALDGTPALAAAAQDRDVLPVVHLRDLVRCRARWWSRPGTGCSSCRSSRRWRCASPSTCGSAADPSAAPANRGARVAVPPLRCTLPSAPRAEGDAA